MNIKELHTPEKAVSAIPILKGKPGFVTAIQILRNQQLKEHITSTSALLICISGEVVFENEKGIKEILLPGDYVNIEANVRHWATAEKDSNLLLIK